MTLNFSPYLPRLALMALLFTSALSATAEETVLFTSTYKGEFSGWQVEMQRSLRQTAPNRYVFASEAKNVFASIREISVFEVEKQQVRPSAYEYLRKVFGRKVRETLTFDWTQGTAVYDRSDRNKDRTQHTLKSGILDPSLYQLFLQRDAYLGKQDLQYDFVKRKRVRTYGFEYLGTDDFHFQGKKLQAIVVKKRSDDDATTVWLVPELDYQIGRLIHKDEDGSTYQVELTAYRADAKAVKEFYKKMPLIKQAAPPPASDSARADANAEPV